MKSHLLCILLLGVYLVSSGQRTTSIEESFYGLSINSPRNKIKAQILVDSRFSDNKKLDTSFLGFNNNSYYGDIISNNLPSTFAVDSATIELTWGYGMMKPYKKGHSLSFLKLAYFVSDSLTSSTLAKMFWDKHKTMSSDTFQVTVGRKEDKNFCFGNKVKLKRKKYLPTLCVLQQELDNKSYVVRIEYERFGD